MTARKAAIVTCIGIGIAPGLARAHTPIAGIGHFYSGALHPFVVPAQLMALIALGMLLGQRGIARLWGVVLAFAAATGLGLLATAPAGAPDTDLWLLLCSLLTALMIALARPVPRLWLAVGAAAIGLLAGLGSSPDGLAGGARWGSLAGTWVGCVLCVLWMATVTEAAVRPWLKVAVRVVASWLAASAMLVLALSWVGPTRGGAAAGPAAAVVQPPSKRP